MNYFHCHRCLPTVPICYLIVRCRHVNDRDDRHVLHKFSIAEICEIIVKVLFIWYLCHAHTHTYHKVKPIQLNWLAVQDIQSPATAMAFQWFLFRQICKNHRKMKYEMMSLDKVNKKKQDKNYRYDFKMAYFYIDQSSFHLAYLFCCYFKWKIKWVVNLGNMWQSDNSPHSCTHKHKHVSTHVHRQAGRQAECDKIIDCLRFSQMSNTQIIEPNP